MFGLKKGKVRRQRAKQLRAESTESLWGRFARRIGLWPTLITALFFVIALIISLAGRRALPYSEHQKISQPIIARVNFTVEDPKQAAVNVKAAREATPSYYRVNMELIDRLIGEVSALHEAAQAESYEKFEERAAAAPWTANQELYARLHAANGEAREQFLRALEELRKGLMHEWTVLPTTDEERDPPSKAGEIIVLKPRAAEESAAGAAAGAAAAAGVEEEHVPTLHLIQIGNRAAVEGRARVLAEPFDRAVRGAVREVLIGALTKEPILVFDQKRTQEAMAAAERAAPPGLKHYEKGKPFVLPRYEEVSGKRAPEEAGLTGADIDLLAREEAAYQKFLRTNAPEAVKDRQRRLYAELGVGMVLLVLSVSLFVYVGLYQKRIFEVHSRSIAFAGLLLICLATVRFIDTHSPYAELALAPVMLAAAILTITYPRRFAAGVTVIYVVLVSVVIRAEMGVMVTLFAGGYVTALLLNDIRTRTKIISAGVGIAAIVFFTSFAFGLIGQQEIGFAAVRAAIAAASAILAALIIQGTLPFIERLFRVATSLTLLEYRDANRPLLRRLAREAPGTYNHSLVLGTMSESACEAIGANGLLAHVGALYHDIGKIPKAEYFAENQEASINRHDNLAPSMSLLIILGHVKDGIELAKEYGLPRVLHPFIAEHHGTTVVRYFHHAASEKKSQSPRGRHDREVPEAEFRYPGPKPASKETAILMLCDGVEGAVRALPEPTPGRIEAIVHQILQERLKDGQFDNCDITLRELHLVEESLVKSLCRFYHGRVAYPKATQAKADQREEPAVTAEVKRQLAG